MYAFGREIAQTLLIVLDELVAVGSTILDTLRDGQTFHHAPPHVVTLYIATQVVYLLAGPHFTVGNVVQGGDNALYANLIEHGKRYLVFLAKPSPCSFH